MSLAQNSPPFLEDATSLSQYITQLIATQSQALKDEIEADRKENKDVINGLQSSVKTLESENKSLKTSIQTLESENKSLKTSTQTLESENKSLKTSIQTLESENKSLKTSIQTLESENESLQISIKSLETKLEKQGNRNQRLNDEKSELKTKVEELEGKVQANKKILDEHEIVLQEIYHQILLDKARKRILAISCYKTWYEFQQEITSADALQEFIDKKNVFTRRMLYGAVAMVYRNDHPIRLEENLTAHEASDEAIWRSANNATGESRHLLLNVCECVYDEAP